MKENRKPRVIFNPKDIPVLGSLGILALGDIGFEAWRKVKQERNKGKRLNEQK